MAAGTKVRCASGKCRRGVSFRTDELRIGRMKENDLIVNNLAVSRFHAVLRRVGDGFEIEDLGSENGTLLDGVAVKGKRALPPGGELTIGKHTLSLQAAGDPNRRPRRARCAATRGSAADLLRAGLAAGAAPAARRRPPRSRW